MYSDKNSETLIDRIENQDDQTEFDYIDYLF